MAGRSELKKLMQSSGLWTASTLECSPAKGISTGFDALDRHLPGGGWPADGVTELLCDRLGIGEFRLLSHALKYLSTTQSRRILLISPPYIPYPPALKAFGVDLNAIVVVRPDNNRDMLWVLEQALESRGCSAVLAWSRTDSKWNDKAIRRLQVACKEGRTWHALFRPEHAMKNASPAELRVHLTPVERMGIDPSSAINVRILKRRGGWETGVIKVRFDDELQHRTPDFSELTITASVSGNDSEECQERPLAGAALPASAG